jgi:hypothetical protein
MFEKHPYNKKFSIAHWDRAIDDNLYFECLKNSSQQFKKEIYDIYFGTTFENDDVTYGNTMGVNASKGQYKNLLKIQEKYNIPISLTLNEMNRPLKLLKEKNIKEFISFIKKYYDDGVRSCTISHTHLMRTGALQSAFPDMNWKNTVNHRIASTQSFIDYTKLGYNTIQLDRDFNRNLAELKRVKLEADRLNVRTCLLISEMCMPECPFKTEHDCWQSGKELKSTGKVYWETVNFTCNRWRRTGVYERGRLIPQTKESNDYLIVSPRTGTDIVTHSKKDWNEFAGAVDIFKMSGRLSNTRPNINKKYIYALEMTNEPFNNLFVVDSFKTIYENNLTPLHLWFAMTTVLKDFPVITDINKIKEGIKNHFWNKKEAVLLSKVLKNCKNQCYKCHKCDDLFKTKKVDSILEF